MAQEPELDGEQKVQHMLVESIDGMLQSDSEEEKSHFSSSAVAYANVLNVDLEEALEDRANGESVFAERERIPALKR